MSVAPFLSVLLFQRNGVGVGGGDFVGEEVRFHFLYSVCVMLTFRQLGRR